MCSHTFAWQVPVHAGLEAQGSPVGSFTCQVLAVWSPGRWVPGSLSCACLWQHTPRTWLHPFSCLDAPIPFQTSALRVRERHLLTYGPAHQDLQNVDKQLLLPHRSHTTKGTLSQEWHPSWTQPGRVKAGELFGDELFVNLDSIFLIDYPS